jgi:hypothetical protein
MSVDDHGKDGSRVASRLLSLSLLNALRPMQQVLCAQLLLKEIE